MKWAFGNFVTVSTIMDLFIQVHDCHGILLIKTFSCCRIALRNYDGGMEYGPPASQEGETSSSKFRS